MWPVLVVLSTPQFNFLGRITRCVVLTQNKLLTKFRSLVKNNCILINTQFTQKTEPYSIKFLANSSTTVMMVWCQKQVRHFILIFSVSETSILITQNV